MIAEAHPDGKYTIIDDERELARLGEGLPINNRLTAGSVERAIKAIGQMRTIAKGYGVERLSVIATSAVRDADNGPDFTARVRDELGITIEVIDSVQEARLAWTSAAGAFDLSESQVCVADIGGGSMQCVLASHGLIEHICRTRLGAVRLMGMFGGAEASSGPRYHDLRSHIRSEVRAALADVSMQPQLLVGTGGTFTTLAAMDLAIERTNFDITSIQGHEVHRSTIRHMLERLLRLPVSERGKIPGLPAERADIIVPGLTVIDELMDALHLNLCRIHDRGIRDGVLLSMVRELFPSAQSPADPANPMRSVRRFAVRCRYEQAHSEHVAALSLALFDHLGRALAAEVHDYDFSPRARVLLEAAAILHDVGYLINYEQHHKHSYHLIVNADLEGFTRREVEVIANVARYHRKSPPKKKHPAYAALDRDDQRLVKLLSAVLRVADGFDRAHTQSVRGMRVAFDEQQRLLTIVVDSDEPIETTCWGAQRKDELLRGVLTADVVYRSPTGEQAKFLAGREPGDEGTDGE